MRRAAPVVTPAAPAAAAAVAVAALARVAVAAALAALALAACEPTSRHAPAAKPSPAAPAEPVAPTRTAVLLQTSGGTDPVLLPVACFDGGTRTFIAGAPCAAFVPHDAHLAEGVTITGPGEDVCRERHTRGFAVAESRLLTGEYLLWPAALQPALVRPPTEWPSGPEDESVPKMQRMLPPMVHPEPTDAERVLIEAAVSRRRGRPFRELAGEYDVYSLDLDGDGHDDRLIGAIFRPRPSGDYVLGALYLVRGQPAADVVEVMASPLHRVFGLVGIDLDGDGRRELVLDLSAKRDAADPDDGAEVVIRLSGPRPEIVARFQPCPPF